MIDSVKYHASSQPVRQLFDLYRGGRLKLEPSFQRKGVWKEKQRVHLIASIFQGYPIPSVFFYRHEDENTGQIVFEVIDGKQRIESLLMYAGFKTPRFSAPLQLREWEVPRYLSWPQLQKQRKQSLLEEYQIQTIEVTGDLSDIIELFVRINSTGNALTRQEISNARFYKTEFLKAAKRLASKFEKYLQFVGVLGAQQILRMKHIELLSELIYAASLGGVGNKKRALDAAMRAESIKGPKLRRAVASTTVGLNRLRRMFPDLSKSVRFSKLSDFYSLVVLIQTFEAEGLILTDKVRNTLAWDLLMAFSTGVDILAEKSRKLELRTLSAGEEILRQYLNAVREDSDSEASRRKRHNILGGLLRPLFEVKDKQRLFSAEQRRILWNSADERVCAECGCELTWEDFHADHIRPYTLGGRTALDNAAILCAAHNLAKGKKLAKTGKKKRSIRH